jgi:hypothetical protein
LGGGEVAAAIEKFVADARIFLGPQSVPLTGVPAGHDNECVERVTFLGDAGLGLELGQNAWIARVNDRWNSSVARTPFPQSHT